MQIDISKNRWVQLHPLTHPKESPVVHKMGFDKTEVPMTVLRQKKYQGMQNLHTYHISFSSSQKYFKNTKELANLIYVKIKGSQNLKFISPKQGPILHFWNTGLLMMNTFLNSIIWLNWFLVFKSCWNLVVFIIFGWKYENKFINC